jgi:hypothetical protein
VAGRRGTRLQHRHGGDVAAQIGQQQQCLAVEGASYGGIHGLQLRARAGRNFHRSRCGAHLKSGIDGEHLPDLHHLLVHFVTVKTLLDDADVISSRRDGAENIPAVGVGGGLLGGVRRNIGQFDRRARNGSALFVGYSPATLPT